VIIEPNMTGDSFTIDARFTVSRRGVLIQINGRQYRLGAALLAGVTRRLLCVR
jgi:hypothetical protein